MDEEEDSRNRDPDEKPGIGERAEESASGGSEADQGTGISTRVPPGRDPVPVQGDDTLAPAPAGTEPTPSQTGEAGGPAAPVAGTVPDSRQDDSGRYIRTAAIAAAVALFALAFFVAGFWVNDALDEDDEGSRASVSLADDPAWGPEDAAVVIQEFGDFECPYCGEFARDTFPRIRDVFGDRIRYVYRDFPLSQVHRSAQKAAEAAQCAHEQGLFWDYHDLLFANQDALGVSDLKLYAENAGANMEEFNTCLDSGKNAWEVLLDVKDGSEAGVSGTPAFIINGLLLPGVRPFEQFQALIEAALANVEGQ